MLSDAARQVAIEALEDKRIATIGKLVAKTVTLEQAEQIVIEIDDTLAELRQPAPDAEWEIVPVNMNAYAHNDARWSVCDDGEIAIVYPGMGVRAPLPPNWRLMRPRAGGEGGSDG